MRMIEIISVDDHEMISLGLKSIFSETCVFHKNSISAACAACNNIKLFLRSLVFICISKFSSTAADQQDTFCHTSTRSSTDCPERTIAESLCCPFQSRPVSSTSTGGLFFHSPRRILSHSSSMRSSRIARLCGLLPSHRNAISGVTMTTLHEERMRRKRGFVALTAPALLSILPWLQE